MSDALINKVAASGLITLKPEEWLPDGLPVPFDLKDYLFQGLILREKDFRDQMNLHGWPDYTDKVVCLFCSADAIIPSWAYMLVTSRASSYAKEVFYGSPDQWVTSKVMQHIASMDIAPYIDQRVIIKGCSDRFAIGPEIYVALTARLSPVVKSLMFGEPCSTVPVYKRPKGD